MPQNGNFFKIFRLQKTAYSSETKGVQFWGIYLLPFFQKTPPSASKPTKIDFFKEIAILRHLEWFLEKNEENSPPPKMANFGGVYFLTFFQKTNHFGARRRFLEVHNQEMINML